MALDDGVASLGDAWADDLPPSLLGPSRGKDKNKGPPTSMPVGTRARISRGPLEGQLVDIESVGVANASVRFVVDGIAGDAAPMEIKLNFLEVVGAVRGPGLGSGPPAGGGVAGGG